MASIVSEQVFSELLKIAQSKSSLRQRRTFVSWRIKQFKTDLAAASLQHGVAEKCMDELAHKLKTAAEYWGPDVEEGIILMNALEKLTGAQRKARQCGAE